VLELAEGDLGEVIGRCQQRQARLGEDEVWAVAEQISSGLVYLHSNNILHRDIKV
jgi:serine/threonine protein kinase